MLTAADSAAALAPAGSRDGDRSAAPARSGRRLAVCAPLTAATIVLSTVPSAQFAGSQWLSVLLAAPVATWGCWPVHTAAWHALGRRPATTDTLASLGVAAAFCSSVYALLFGGAGPLTAQVTVALTGSLGDRQALFPGAAAGVTTAVLASRYLEGRAGVGSADAQRLASQVAAVFVPCVIALSVVTLGFWLGTGLAAITACSAAIAVLVVACPCALGLAAPVALAAAIRRGSEIGIRVRRPAALAAAGQIRAVVIDLVPMLAAPDGEPRPGAAAAVARLRALGLMPVVLAHGDRARAAGLAARLGVPADQIVGAAGDGRAAVVAELRAAGYRVALAGNALAGDAALAAADIAITPEPAHGAAAVGDLTFSGPDPGRIADAIGLATATTAMTRINLCWALGYNVVAIPLAALGYLNPLLAGIIMLASTSVVAANGLLLRRFSPRRASR